MQAACKQHATLAEVYLVENELSLYNGGDLGLADGVQVVLHSL